MTDKKLLFISVAVNIFLAAFVLGRVSATGTLTGTSSAVQAGGMFSPPPPPMFGAEDLLGPDIKDLPEIEQHFAEMQKLRQDFATRLKQGPVTKDEARAHFAEVDRRMDSVKAGLQDKLAEKIAGMNDADRARLAARLMEKGPPQGPGPHGPDHDGPDHDGPDHDGPGPRGPGFGQGFGGPPEDMMRGPPPNMRDGMRDGMRDDRRGPPPDMRDSRGADDFDEDEDIDSWLDDSFIYDDMPPPPPPLAADEFPLDKPNASTPEILSWTADAAMNAMTFDHTNYQKELQKASKNFTKEGWGTFTTALQQSEMLDTLQNRKESITSKPKTAPTLLKTEVMKGRYRWIVETPLLVKHESEESRTDIMTFLIVVERVPAADNPAGYSIAEWSVTNNRR